MVALPIRLTLIQLIRLFVCFFIMNHSGLCHAGLTGRSFFSPRPQSCNTVFDIVGWQDYINRCANGCFYTACAATVAYTNTFKPAQIAEYFFGADKLTFSGSASPLRGPNDILADYFGLPVDYNSSVVFSPSAKTALCDFAWYCGLDGWAEGSYVRVHAPLVYTTFNFDMCETIQNAGTSPYPAGYMAANALDRSLLNASVRQAFQGSKAVGDIQPLSAGLITGAHHKVGLSEIEIVMGYNPVLAPQHHFGFNVRLACPTGTTSKSRYVFEPVIGNGGHWQLGIGFTGHAIFYDNPDTCKRFGVYADATISHLFSSRQRRSFDIDGAGVFSRYVLLEKMVAPAPVGLSLTSSFVPAANQYQRELIPAVNVTSLFADISVAIQADFAIKMAYWYKNMSIDIGYNAWARTAEDICNREKFPAGVYALKGDALVYGFDMVDALFVPLNATESRSTIQAGQGIPNTTLENMNVDNAQAAFFNTNPLYATTAALDSVRGSLQAILLKNCDLHDLSGVSPTAITHKFFVHLSYDFKPVCYVFVPYAGLGASVEIDGSDTKTRSGFSQWAVWLKAGFAC